MKINLFRFGIFTTFLSVLGSMVYFFLTSSANAVLTNESNWTRENAAHLAQRVLFGASQSKIDELYQAGSAQAAVELLFPDINGPSRDQMNQILLNYTSTGFSFTNEQNMRSLYQIQYALDPYPAKAKLFSLFEDIFSINVNPPNITFIDLQNHQKLLSENLFLSYKDLVKKIIFDPNHSGDYAMGRFLDLLNGQNINSPNENYARELLQLFLMGEYRPGDSFENGNTRNYTEADVAALAKLLTGFRADPNTHEVSYDPVFHYTGSGVNFLTGAFLGNEVFPFYNPINQTIDSQLIDDPILGNRGLSENVIDYIFAKRKDAIAEFLADRIIKFYAHDKPTKGEVASLAQKILEEDFQIFPVIRSYLASSDFYENSVIKSLRYKNPLELFIGTVHLLHGGVPTTIDPILLDPDGLYRLDWRPFFPGSIFGRDGFDSNENWFTSYIHNQWISAITRMVYQNSPNGYQFNTIVPPFVTNLAGEYTLPFPEGFTGSFTGFSGSLQDGSGGIITGWTPQIFSEEQTASGFTFSLSGAHFDVATKTLRLENIPYQEGAFLSLSGSFSSGSLISPLGKNEILDSLERHFLGSGSFINQRDSFLNSLTNSPLAQSPDRLARHMLGILLAQPEYILLSGSKLSSDSESTKTSLFTGNKKKLIFVDLGGGYDWLHGIIPRGTSGDLYQELRTTGSGQTIAISPENQVPLTQDFAMNKALAYGSGGTESFKYLFDTNYLRIFNRVGSPYHSRDHDQAKKQVTSFDSSTNSDSLGLFGSLIQNELHPENTISLSGKRPTIFRGGKYINIGPSGSVFRHQGGSLIPTQEKTAYFDLVRSTIMNRSSFPESTQGNFQSAILIDQIASQSVAAGGPDGAGWGNVNNLKFLKKFLENDIGSVFYMQADGGYDTHSNQLANQSNFDPLNVPRDLNYNIGKVAENFTRFFLENKENSNLAIVIFSEFGRTLRVNGDLGTDHGTGGGIFLISNIPEVLSSFPEKIYGNLNIVEELRNWMGVGIDYRSIYTRLYQSLYGILPQSLFPSAHVLEDDASLEEPKFSYLRKEYSALNDTNIREDVKFSVETNNFDMTKGSNFQIETGDSSSTAKKVNQWNIDGILLADKSYRFRQDWLRPNTQRYLSLKAISSQYKTKTLSSESRTPIIYNSSKFEAGTGLISIYRAFEGTRVAKGSGSLLVGSGLILQSRNNTGTLNFTYVGSGAQLSLSGVTRIQSAFTEFENATWNGGFYLPHHIGSKSFLPESAILHASGAQSPLQDGQVDTIIQVGADTLGVGLELSQPVQLEISNLGANKSYRYAVSHDGKNWNLLGSGTSTSSGWLQFPITTFSYYAIINENPVATLPPTCSLSISESRIRPGQDMTLNWTTNQGYSRTLQPYNLTLSTEQGTMKIAGPNAEGTHQIQLAVGNSIGDRSCYATIIVANDPIPEPPRSSGGGGGGVPGAFFIISQNSTIPQVFVPNRIISNTSSSFSPTGNQNPNPSQNSNEVNNNPVLTQRQEQAKKRGEIWTRVRNSIVRNPVTAKNPQIQTFTSIEEAKNYLTQIPKRENQVYTKEDVKMIESAFQYLSTYSLSFPVNERQRRLQNLSQEVLAAHAVTTNRFQYSTKKMIEFQFENLLRQ